MPSATNGRPLSIAAYGIVEKQGGSVASADSVVLEHLLRRGHRVDFYAFRGYVDPVELNGSEGYRYIPVDVGPIRVGWRALERLPGPLRRLPSLLYSQISNHVLERAVGREIAREHRGRPYDLLLALGLLAPFRVPGLPAVSWPQGPPLSEWRTFRSLARGPLRPYLGRRLYAGLAALYGHKARLSRVQVGHSDRVLCGSRWAAGEWEEFGLPAGAVLPVTYPFDLDLFRPAPRSDEARPPRFLWLGRIVPRKRLDLALEAFKRLRVRYPDAELLIIGQFSYGGGLRRLLDDDAGVGGVEYRPSIPRDEVPALLSRVDAVLQPGEAENLGSTALEAMACGVPSVVGPTNGTIDYLDPSSVVFDAYTPEAVEAALARIIEVVRADRDGVAAGCRATAERLLSAETVVDQLEAIFGATIAEAAARPAATA